MDRLCKLSLEQRTGAIKSFQDMKSPNHRVILLLGPVGVGKSSFVNFVAGEPVAKVEAGLYSATTESTCCDIEIQGRCLRVVDIPGSFDHTRNYVKDISDSW